MRVHCLGGGPGGLFTAILLRVRGLADEVTVFERNGPDDTFGFGIVFSEETFENLEQADPASLESVAKEFRRWGDIDIVRNGRTWTSTGHGFSAMERLRFLQLLAARAEELGVKVRYRTEVDIDDIRDADLVVAADGANSAVRNRFADVFRPRIELGEARYAWFGTTHMFDSFTFLFARTDHGTVQAHCYPYSADMSTLIVEMAEATWQAAGFDSDRLFAAGESDAEALAFTETMFADHLGGRGLVGNNSKWIRFPRITNERWFHDNIVLVGDAVHTAHFSIGSGTKLAMEDAIALVSALEDASSVPVALAGYQESRRPEVESLQRAAATSRRWFESVDRYSGLDDEQFVFQLLTRSQRITYDNLELRDPALVARVRSWYRLRTDERLRPDDPETPPMYYPLRLRGVTIPNRVGVSPMAQYSAIDGVPNDWHLVHLGSRAVGGAGIVFTEMTCVSPEGRITPRCTGMWNREQQSAWAGIVDFIHGNSNSKVGLQLGHAGRKASMKVPWEAGGDDYTPLDTGNWPVVGPSPVRWLPHNQVPQALDTEAMAKVREDHVRSARLGAEVGFDLLELHMAHGYLLSSFISPLSNLRGDRYGGDLEARMRFPLEVFDAVREVWPDELPMSVRISATDWYEGGNDGEDAVAISAMFKAHGCDIIDVSTGQTHPEQSPDYGRLYQTPFSDRIRQEAGIPTMTVGAVSSVDDVNTILVAGRADLCLLARPHLVDPYWTLNAAMDQGYEGHPWPDQYLPARVARRREQDPMARLT